MCTDGLTNEISRVRREQTLNLRQDGGGINRAAPPATREKWSVGAGSPNDCRQSSRHDADVQPERPLLDVLAVEVHDVLEIHHRAATADLPQARDSGLRVQPAEMMVLIGCEVRLEKRPRSDEGHVSPEDVPALRKLVEAPAAKQ